MITPTDSEDSNDIVNNHILDDNILTHNHQINIKQQNIVEDLMFGEDEFDFVDDNNKRSSFGNDEFVVDSFEEYLLERFLEKGELMNQLLRCEETIRKLTMDNLAFKNLNATLVQMAENGKSKFSDNSTQTEDESISGKRKKSLDQCAMGSKNLKTA